MASRIVHHGSKAFEFESIDSHGSYINIRVLKPFGGLKPDTIIDGISINTFTFECYWWNKEEKRKFMINDLASSQDNVDRSITESSASIFDALYDGISDFPDFGSGHLEKRAEY